MVQAAFGITKPIIFELEPRLASGTRILFCGTSADHNPPQHTINSPKQNNFHVPALTFQTILVSLNDTVIYAISYANSIYQSKPSDTLDTNCVLNTNTIRVRYTKTVSQTKSWQASDTCVVAQLLTPRNKKVAQIVLKHEVASTYSATALSVVSDAVGYCENANRLRTL